MGKSHLKNGNFYKASMETDYEIQKRQELLMAYNRSVQAKADKIEANKRFNKGDVGIYDNGTRDSYLLSLGRYSIDYLLGCRHPDYRLSYPMNLAPAHLYLRVAMRKDTNGLRDLNCWSKELFAKYSDKMQAYYENLCYNIESGNKFKINLKELIDSGAFFWYNSEDGIYNNMYRGYYYVLYFSAYKYTLKKMHQRQQLEIENPYGKKEKITFPVYYEDVIHTRKGLNLVEDTLTIRESWKDKVNADN
jgi:hypothetical protein